MTPNEFKAWFDGFTEAFSDKTPTIKQWKRICERVAEIDGKQITERVFVDRWWPYIYHHYPYVGSPNPLWCGGNVAGASSYQGQLQAAQNNLNVLNDGHTVQCSAFDAPTAMYALGKADAASLSSHA